MTTNNGKALINELYERLHSWQSVADELGISKAMAWRISNEEGYEPQHIDTRRKLGFPVPVITWQGPKGTFVKRDRPG